MADLRRTLIEFCGLLESLKTPHMVIGGWAAATWGQERSTQDIDVTVLVADEDMAAFIETIKKSYAIRHPDPAAFAQLRRVLPAYAPDGSKIDIIFALLPFEEAAIERARRVSFDGAQIRMCSPEDVILHKIFSDRPHDYKDVEAIMIARKNELDFAYLEPRVRELAAELGISSILERWQALKASIQSVDEAH